MVDDLRHWDLDDEVRDSVLACDVDLPCALDLPDVQPAAPSSPPPALDSDEDVDPSIR